tara:strand:+ start:578 stop:868 length:291 start_codon:yes stop_codon:yes gene_type:complete
MSTYDMPDEILKIYENDEEESKREILAKERSKWARKNFSSNIWDWTDNLILKLMNINKELKDENKNLKDKYNKLYKLHIKGTPTDGYEVGPYDVAD